MVNICPGFLLLVTLLYFSGGLFGVCACLSGALAHELGHLTALTFFSCPVEGIRLCGTGFVINTRKALTPGQESCVLAAGPFGGLLFAALCLGLGGHFFLYAGAAALLGTFFNLLPVLPLDGGRLLQLCLLRFADEALAERILTVIGILLSLSFTLLGIICTSAYMFFTGLWLAVITFTARKA